MDEFEKQNDSEEQTSSYSKDTVNDPIASTEGQTLDESGGGVHPRLMRK